MGAEKGLTQPEASLELRHHLHSGPGGGAISHLPHLPRAPPPTGTFPVAPKSRGQGTGDPATPVREGAPLIAPNPAPTSRKGLGGPARQGHRPSVQPQFHSRAGPRFGAGEAPISPEDSSQHMSPGRARWPQPGIVYPHTTPKGRSYKIHILGKTAQTEGVTYPRSQGGRAAVRTPRWHGTGWSNPPTAPLGQGLLSRMSPRPQETSTSHSLLKGPGRPWMLRVGPRGQACGGWGPRKGPPGPAWLHPPPRRAAGSTLCSMS